MQSVLAFEGQSLLKTHGRDEKAQRRRALLPQESLPFTVKLVRSEAELQKAVQVRYAAYSRHLPEFAETLKEPEDLDRQDGVAILLAESKLDGEPIGTMRIQTNLHAPLVLEKSIQLPSWLAACPLAEATRLSVTGRSIGRLVKTVLFKAYYEFCLSRGIEWMVITARAPLDRQYDQLLFSDVFPGEGFIPVKHVGNIPHRILAFEVQTAEERWRAVDHPLCQFVFDTVHTDVNLYIEDALALQ